MYTKLLFSVLILLSINATAQNYIPVDDGSNVHFTIKNFGFNTGGDFKGLKGKIFFNPSFPATATFSVTISAATINTKYESRDKDLRKQLYFDVEKFPEITLISSKIDKTNKTEDGFYFFTGNLTIKGVTKPLSFPFKVERVLNSFLFTGEFTLNRLDFGVGEKSTVLSQKVVVNLKVLAKTK